MDAIFGGVDGEQLKNAFSNFLVPRLSLTISAAHFAKEVHKIKTKKGLFALIEESE